MSIIKSLQGIAVKTDITHVGNIAANNYRDDGFWMFGNDGVDRYFSSGERNSSLKAYLKCPPVAAVINKKGQAYINGKTWILSRSGKSKGKESGTAEAQKLRKLLRDPNPLQSWKEFELQAYTYQQLFGYTVILPIIPTGFQKYGPIEAVSLWNIPPFMLEIEEEKSMFYQSDRKKRNPFIKSIKIKYKDTESYLDPENIFILKDSIPSFSSIIFPDSRVCSLEMPINNIIGAFESRNVLINYRGALGVFTNDPGSGQFANMPLQPKDKEDLQKDFLRYGMKNKQWKFIISSASLKWQQIGIPTKDLMLFEEVEDSVMRICDGFNFPYRLMASEKGNSLGGNDVKEFMKQLYQDAIIPEAEANYELINQIFRTEEYNLIIDKDYSHINALQADQKAAAEARFKRNQALLIEFQNNMMTLNRWLELNGEDPMQGDEGNMYYYQLVELGWKFGNSNQNVDNRNNTDDEEKDK